MSALFLKIVNMSIAASWLVLAVLLLRLILKKAPKWVNVLLWGFVAVRLLMPFSVESNFSLVPEQLVDGQIVSYMTPHSDGDFISMNIHEHDLEKGLSLVSSTITDPSILRAEGYSFSDILGMIWLVGVGGMAVYLVVSYVLLRRKVATGVWVRNNIYLCENAASPFVFGFFRPRIYLPYWMGDRSAVHVIAHEEAHIRRKDHWWKPLGFVLLTLHWFNPLIWLGYILLCRDIELACDEKVIKGMDSGTKADYTQALVDCSINRRIIAACPLAFGEVGVKERVRSVMNYKKPGFWVLLAATLACIVVAVCFLTDPKEQPTAVIVLSSQNYAVQEVTSVNGIYSFAVIAGENSPVYSITNDMYLSSQGEYGEGETWTELGKLEEIELTSGNFDELFEFSLWTEGTNALKIRRETQQAWKLIYDDEFLYYVLQQKDGDLYLAYGYTSDASGEASIRWLFKLAPQSNDLGPEEAVIAEGNTVSAEEEYERVVEDYNLLKASVSTMTEDKLDMAYAAYADLFNRIASGSSSQQKQYAQLVRQLINSNVVFEDHEVFEIAKDYAETNSRFADGDQDMGVQDIELKKTSAKTARLDFPYWGEMWYSVKMVHIGEDWVTGEFTDPYQGELGQYLMSIEFHDQEPSVKLMKQCPAWIDHHLRISRLGADRQFTMQIKFNASHGYNVYIGSDEPFCVEEQSSVRLSRLFGTVSVNLNFDSSEAAIATEEVISETEPVTEPVTIPTTEPVIDDTMVAPALDVLDTAISKAILEQCRNDEVKGPINSESHIILGRASISGTPLVGQLGAVREEMVLVYCVNQRFRLSGEYLEETVGTAGEAVITFSLNEDGEYVLKEFIKAENYDPAILKNFVSDLEPIREKEKGYAEHLRISCWNTASAYLNDLRALGDADFNGGDPKLFLDKCMLDLDADGYADLLFGSAVELLSQL